MAPTKPHYRAFISYSHKDAKWAKWLHRGLERYVVPVDAFAEGEKLDTDGTEKSRRLTPIFRDREELPASGSLSDTIQQALESSENLIVLCSPNSVASQYVNDEIEIFRGLHPDNENKIYALIIDGEPPECFPPALISNGAEPVAADARESGDGKTDAKLKLIAGMLSVGLDRLKRREANRQRNRLLMIVSMVSAVAVITSALALWALKAENEANAQRALAEQQRGIAEEQREQAERSAREAQAVLAFYNTNVIAAVKPKSELGGLGIDVTITEAVDAAEPKISKTFAGQPLIEASVRTALGNAYNFSGDNAAEIVQCERAFELRKQELGPEHRDTLVSMMNLAIAYGGARRKAESLALSEEMVKLAKKTLGPEDHFTIMSQAQLAGAYLRVGRGEEGVDLNKKLLQFNQKTLGFEHRETLESMVNLAVAYGVAGRGEDAITLHEETLRLRKKVLGPEHMETLGSLRQLSGSYSSAGRHDEAVTLGEEVVLGFQKIWGIEHPATLITMSSLASSYWVVKRKEEAITLHKKTLQLRKKVLGPEHRDTVITMKKLARIYQRLGRMEEAERQWKELLAVQKKQHPDEWGFYHNQAQLGSVLTRRKRYAEAEVLLLSAHDGLKIILDEQGLQFTALHHATTSLANLYENWNKPEKAAEWLVKVKDLEMQVNASRVPKK